MKPVSGPKRIAVVGCGSLGSLFAGLLAIAGHEVWGAARDSVHREAITAHGLLVRDGDYETIAPIRACSELPASSGSGVRPFDLVLVTVKSYDTATAARSLAAALPPETPVLTLQNGLGNAETLAAFLPGRRILAGSTTFGALREGSGVVRLMGRGECVVGEWRGGDSDDAALDSIRLIFETAGIPVRIKTDVRSVLWRKLAVSAAINPLTALLRVCNGELVEPAGEAPRFREGVGEIARGVVSEIAAVAAKCGVALPLVEELLRDARAVCRSTAGNRSSMFRDAERGLRTEIGAINGAAARIAAERGADAAFNRKLTALVEAGERFATVASLSAALDD